MSSNYYLFGLGVAILIMGIVINGRHVHALNEEQRLIFMREGNPAPLLGLLTMALVAILVSIDSLFWIVVVSVGIFLETGLAAWWQNRHLKKLQIPEAWIRKKSMVDLIFAVAGGFVVASLVYPKLQLLARL